MVFTPTTQQRNIQKWVDDNVGFGGSLVVQACAGSGKSTSIVWVTNGLSPDLDWVMTSFGRFSVRDLKEKSMFKDSIRSYNSFGYMGVRRAYPDVKFDEDKIDKIIAAKTSDRYIKWPVKKLVSMVKNLALRNPTDDTMYSICKEYDIDLKEEEWPEYQDKVFELAHYALDKSFEMKSIVDFDDQIWFPIYDENITMPHLDLVLADELNDTNKAQGILMGMAVKDDSVFIGVGDTFQCQPPGTLIKMTGDYALPIEDVRVGDIVASFDRHSGCIVGAYAQGRKVKDIDDRYYEGNLIHLSTKDKDTYCTPNHKWVVRWNTRETDLYATYIMRKGNSYRVGQCQLFNRQGTNHFSSRCRLEKADCGWILNIHNNRRDAAIEEASISYSYGIPMTTFEPVTNSTLDRDALDKIFHAWETTTDSEIRIIRLLRSFGREIDYPYYIKNEGRSGRTTVFEALACNLFSEYMSVPTYTGTKNPTWEPITISREYYEGMVYSLDIESHHTYIANGIVTHNSIYAFRGADSTAMPSLIEKFHADTLPLSISWRCSQAIGKWVNEKFPNIPFEVGPNAQVGAVRNIDLRQITEQAKLGDIIVSRVNAPLVPVAFQYIRRGIKATIQGRDIGKSLVTLVKKQKAYDSVPVLFQKLYAFREKENEKFIALDKPNKIAELDDRIATIEALSEDANTPDEIIHRAETIFSDEAGGILLSSIHRAKGLEGNNVFILRPDLLPHPKAKTETDLMSERNIEYVAGTRGKSDLVWVHGKE